MKRKGHRHNVKMNKRGVFQAIAVVIVLGVFLFALGIFLTRLDAPMKKVLNHTQDMVDSPQAQDTLTRFHDRQSSYTDGVFLFIFGGLWLAGLLVGYYNEQGGPLMIVFFILLVISLLVVGNLSDYWKEYTDESQKLASRTLYPSTYWILDNLMLCMLIVLVSGVIVNHFKA